MRIFVTGVILILNIVLQSTVFQLIQIRNVMPNTAVIIIVSYALLRGSVSGAVVGFFSGLIQDVLFGMSIGYYACLGMLVGYVCGKVNVNFYRENYIMPLTLCALSTIAYETAVYVSGFLMRGNLNYFYYALNIIVPEAVYTAVVSIVIYRLLYGINDWLEEKERYKRKVF